MSVGVGGAELVETDIAGARGIGEAAQVWNLISLLERGQRSREVNAYCSLDRGLALHIQQLVDAQVLFKEVGDKVPWASRTCGPRRARSRFVEEEHDLL